MIKHTVDSIKNAVTLNKATTNHETKVAIVEGKEKKVDKKVSFGFGSTTVLFEICGMEIFNHVDRVTEHFWI